MPTYPPRSEPVRKKEDLDFRLQMLHDSIQNMSDLDQLKINAEKYRVTRLLYNKAVLHVIREKEFQEKPHSYNREKVLKDIEEWTTKSVEEIIEEVKAGVDRDR